MDERARLTPVDIAYVGVAVFIFLMLVPSIYELFNLNVASLGQGDAYLLRMIIPGAILAVLAYVMATAVGR